MMANEEAKGIDADRLREALRLRNLRPSELARRADVTDATISYVLSGRRTRTRAHNVAAIARELDVSIEWLMGASDSMEPDRTTLGELLGELVRVARQLPVFRQRDLLLIARAYLEEKE